MAENRQIRGYRFVKAKCESRELLHFFYSAKKKGPPVSRRPLSKLDGAAV